MSRKRTAPVLTPYEQFKYRAYRFVLYFDKPVRIPDGLSYVVVDCYKSRPFKDACECHRERLAFELRTKCFRNKIRDEIIETEEFDSVQFELACCKLL
jgi:hypothetical protein